MIDASPKAAADRTTRPVRERGHPLPAGRVEALQCREAREGHPQSFSGGEALLRPAVLLMPGA